MSKAETEHDILFKAIKLGNVGLVVDCGANHGQFHGLCRDSGYSGPMVCIEPHPDCIATLEDLRTRDPELVVMPVATSNEITKLDLHSAGAQNVFSSFLEQKAWITERFKRTRIEGSFEVEVTRLDAILDELHVARDKQVLLKLDTQGYDLKTLEGLGQRIDQVRVIKVEMAVQAIYEGAPTHWQILDFVHSNGLEPFFFSTVTRDHEGRYIEYDAYFIR